MDKTSDYKLIMAELQEDPFRSIARYKNNLNIKKTSHVLRIVKSGRGFIYEIGFVSDNPKDALSMRELDNIRQEVEDRLKSLYDNPIWLDISFMYDKKWG